MAVPPGSHFGRYEGMGLRRHVGAVAALCLLAGMAPAVAQCEPWVEARSPHFVVASDAGRGTAERIAVHFEKIRAAIKSLWPWARVDPPIPLKILATRGEDGLKLLIPESWEGKGRAHPVGAVQPGFGRPWIALRADLAEPGPGSESPYSLIQHEYLHLVLNLNFERVPLWLGEGMAELIGGTVVRVNGVAVGRPVLGHVRLLRTRKLLPVETLFLVDRRSPEYTEQNRTNLFYAESWALVRYMMLDPKASHDPRFKAFVGKVVQGMESLAALRAEGLSAAEVDQGLLGYVRRLEPLADVSVADQRVTTREITAAEWSGNCGAFLVDRGRLADGRRLLEQAERQDADLAVVQEALGLALFREKQPEEARDRLERATHLDPTRATAHFLAGRMTLQTAFSGASRAEARAHLEKAIQLAPDYDLAHAELAEALLADHDVSRALDHASRAVSLAPASGPHRLTLARALMAAEQVGDAQSEAKKAIDLGLSDSQDKIALALLESPTADAGSIAPAPRLATAPVGRTVAWGVFVDEGGQSRIEANGARIEITAPAGAYDLSPEIGNVSAPRLMRPVEGDFVAQVGISKAPQIVPTRGSPIRAPLGGAGLLLWLDEKNFVRLELAGSITNGTATRYALLELRRNGLALGGLGRPRVHLDDAAASLRLERHGRSLLAFVRQGEGEWTPAGHLEMDLPSEVYLGVAAVNATQAPFVAVFEDFTVSPVP